MEKSKQVINNAIAAYLMLGVAWILLFAKKNPAFSHPFVRSHIKTASFLHLLLALTIFFFLLLKVFVRISFLGFSLNILLANIFFVLLFLSLAVGVFKASKGLYFGVGESVALQKQTAFSVKNTATKLKEQDKLTCIIALVPFLGYIYGPRFEKNAIIKNNLLLNIWASLLMATIFILGHTNIGSLLLLLYTVFVTFYAINLYARDELLTIELPSWLTPGEIAKHIKAGVLYLTNYMRGKFTPYIDIVTSLEKNDEQKAVSGEAFLGPKWLIYLPIFNLFTLFQRHTLYKYHIRNGVILSLLLLVILVLILTKFLSYKYLLLFLFPLTFGIGKLYKKYYKMPGVYGLYSLFFSESSLVHRTKKTLKEKSKEVHEEKLQVKTTRESSEKNTEEIPEKSIDK